MLIIKLFRELMINQLLILGLHRMHYPEPRFYYDILYF